MSAAEQSPRRHRRYARRTPLAPKEVRIQWVKSARLRPATEADFEIPTGALPTRAEQVERVRNTPTSALKGATR